MTGHDPRLVVISEHAAQVSLNAHALFYLPPADHGMLLGSVRRDATKLAEAVHAFFADPEAPATFFVCDEDGTFLETQRGTTRETIVADILDGQFAPAQVFCQQGAVFEDVTASVAAEVLASLARSEAGDPETMPTFLWDHVPAGADALRSEWMTADDHRRDAEADAADRDLRAAMEMRQEAAE